MCILLTIHSFVFFRSEWVRGNSYIQILPKIYRKIRSTFGTKKGRGRRPSDCQKQLATHAGKSWRRFRSHSKERLTHLTCLVLVLGRSLRERPSEGKNALRYVLTGEGHDQQFHKRWSCEDLILARWTYVRKTGFTHASEPLRPAPVAHIIIFPARRYVDRYEYTSCR
jgi:hypothetical protein